MIIRVLNRVCDPHPIQIMRCCDLTSQMTARFRIDNILPNLRLDIALLTGDSNVRKSTETDTL